VTDDTFDELDELEAEIEALVYAKARDDFYTYVQIAAPLILPEGFRDGRHIRAICKALQDAYEGKTQRRVMIFLPPRSSKSTLSVLFQSWIIGRHPMWTMMGISYARDLATDWSRQIRNLVGTPEYQKIFPGVDLAPDAKAANRWNTSKGGRYFAGAITAGIAGRGAHVAVIDDPLSEQDAISKVSKQFVRNWYPGGLRTRLHPAFNMVIIISTRWALDDLPGWLLEEAEKSSKAEQWVVVNFPAIIYEKGVEESYWPEWKPLKDLQALRDDPTMPRGTWAALYQQNPVPEDGGLIKEEYFQWWKQDEPLPECTAFILSVDGAFSTKETADFSVVQVWGIFEKTQVDSRGREHIVPCALLLANRKGRWDYPEFLKEVRKLNEKYQPDQLLIEKKASGEVLIPDLVRQGLPVIPFVPGKGQDKLSRVHAILRYLVGKCVWLPEGEAFAEELLNECLQFPYGRHDDQLDAMTLGLLYLRDATDIIIPDDIGDPPERMPKRKTYWNS
jgi:predicted phage terminase large subunit-like protein